MSQPNAKARKVFGKETEEGTCPPLPGRSMRQALLLALIPEKLLRFCTKKLIRGLEYVSPGII
jgi:hypothetical protein